MAFFDTAVLFQDASGPCYLKWLPISEWFVVVLFRVASCSAMGCVVLIFCNIILHCLFDSLFLFIFYFFKKLNAHACNTYVN